MCFNSVSLELMNRCVLLVGAVVVGPGVVGREVVVLTKRVAMACVDGEIKLVAERGATEATVNNLKVVLNRMLTNI